MKEGSMSYLDPDNWFELINSVAEPTHYTFRWDISELQIKNRHLYHWYENEHFIIALWSHIDGVGATIKIFPKVFEGPCRPMLNRDVGGFDPDMRLLLSGLSDPKRLTLCIGIDWASKFLESVLKTNLAVAA
jgi:hypothetical protein